MDKDTHYPPHAAKLLEEHFYHFYVSNTALFPADIEYVPVMWISHMHNMQLLAVARQVWYYWYL